MYLRREVRCDQEKPVEQVGRRVAVAGREVARLGLGAWVSPECVESDASGSRG